MQMWCRWMLEKYIMYGCHTVNYHEDDSLTTFSYIYVICIVKCSVYMLKYFAKETFEEKGYIGVHLVQVATLSLGSLEEGYRVRELNASQVKKVEQSLAQASDLTSIISVLKKEEGRWIVIDGNHRIKAIKNIRYGPEVY